MKVLVLNSGSSSVKYRLFDMERREEVAGGVVERIGEAEGALTDRVRRADGGFESTTRRQPVADHRGGFALIGEALRTGGGLDDPRALFAIGHRVVHGGEAFRAPTRIDAGVLAAIREVAPLAPLHNPANLIGIEAALEAAPGVPQVAVFDTAFHQTMPAHAYRYAVPEDWYVRYRVRRYGFHGTSHAYVSRRAAAHLGRPPEAVNLITLHLGNGASAAAIAGGFCVDTSMGMTPLEGLVMGTRSGDLDPAVAFYLGRVAGLGPAEVEAALNQASGLEGLCGVHDMREVHRAAEAGEARARLALEVFAYRIRKYVGAYTAVLGRVDAVVFTGGIGENDADLRRRVCEGLDGLGIGLDGARNAAATGEVCKVHRQGSRVAVLVVRTNEELEIAEQTVACVRGAAVGDPHER
ncbi:MAG: acetate kinase [Gammaproteobacteria bacterium]|nr:acetate kinase [Gammaproteobacteria bacterium]